MQGVEYEYQLYRKKLIDIILFRNFRKKRSTAYWWELREAASTSGIRGYIKKQQYHKLVESYNAFIPLQVSFSEKPTMPHGISGVFISSGAKIGKGCTIFHQVTIGSNTLSDSRHCGAPTIGDNVYIGCGAKIIGNVTIGNNVRIGANCVITCNIPSDCTVVLEKPRIISKDNSHNGFISYSDFTNQTNSVNSQ